MSSEESESQFKMDLSHLKPTSRRPRKISGQKHKKDSKKKIVEKQTKPQKKKPEPQKEIQNVKKDAIKV